MNTKRVELLDHPLVQSLIIYKWRKYGSIFYYTNLAIYLTFLIALNIYAFHVVRPFSDGKTNLDNCSETYQAGAGYVCKTTDETQDPIILASGAVVIGLSVIRLLIELVQIGIQRSKYLGFNNILELFLFALSIYFCTNIFAHSKIPSAFRWQIGVVCVFMSWMNLMMFLRKVRELASCQTGNEQVLS